MPQPFYENIVQPTAVSVHRYPDFNTFIASYNEEARPFVWTKSVVHQKRMKPCFAV
jgi:hypothetical protein